MSDQGPKNPPQPAYVPVRRARWDSGSELSFDHKAWLHLLSIAFRFGWRPAGTDEPEHWEFNPWSRDRIDWWRGDYFSNVGQRISTSDARALGGAIERALPDVPRGDSQADKAVWRLDLPNARPLHWTDPRESLNAFEYFSGPRRATLERFCELCRAGGFTLC